MSTLAAIERPNGKMYRPRMLSGTPTYSAHEEFNGAVVFGTHDIETARPIAEQLIRSEADAEYIEGAKPHQIWWRDGFECGQRRFATDPEHGRAGVWFEVEL